ncbi:AsnC family transcriptional regulator [Haladaptatus sp. R4]|uniref:HTH-type transcriptional regulator Lrp n=1 Tax=Haladaptatus sp. R4 TaxID=1679489 RepID=UPI0007B4B88E|nr:HTH-type transcriptional regulator Lrp [Haladaptatus sp. R4]KZN23108.1 AsnC family transcriptional regulator [Haladaptatus sp. R4]
MTYETLDTELINILLDDGRANLRSIADELDVSVTTVSNHLENLQETDVVTGYTPTLDYSTLGYDVTAVIQLKVDGTALPEVIARLQDQSQMISVYEVTGDHDIIAIGKYSDTDQMNQQIKTLLSDAEINESNTSVVLNAASEHEQFKITEESEGSRTT